MNTTEIDHISRLKVQVEDFIGFKVRYAKNCDILSEIVLEKTGQTVSSSTLKRFWGIIKRKFNPSRYTLDTLSRLIGFENWESFCFEHKIISKFNNFHQIKEKFYNISKANINFLKKQTPYFFLRISKREFAVKKMYKFLESQKKITSFIAQDGFGKSEILISLAEHFFVGKEAIFPNDLFLFINFSTVNFVDDENYDIYNLLATFFPELNKTQLENEFAQMLKNKRFVLFFDKICKIYKNDTIFPKILKTIYDILIGKFSELNIKIVVTCKSSDWTTFEREFNQSDYIRSKWFDLDFENRSNFKTNIPLLTRNEIIQIIQTNNKSLNYSYILENTKLLELISIPYFLNIYLSVVSQNTNITDEIDLLNYYLKEEIFSGFLAKEKLSIIEKILDLTHYGKSQQDIDKNLLNLSIKEEMAYNKLVQADFLNEYVSVTDYFEVKTLVNFSNTIIYRFVIINSWLRKFQLSVQTIFKILNFYTDIEKLQKSLFVWIIKIAAKKNNVEIFKNIYPIVNQYFIKGNPQNLEESVTQKLLHRIGIELRKNESLRNSLIDFYMNDAFAKDLYFRYFIDFDYLVIYYSDVLEKFSLKQSNNTDLFFSNLFIFWKNYFSKNYIKANEILTILQNNILTKNHTIFECCYLACYNILYFEVNNKSDDYNISKLYSLFHSIENFENKYQRNLTYFLFIEALNCNNQLDLMNAFFTRFLSENNRNTSKNKYLTSFLNIYLARLYIAQNQFNEAFNLLHSIDAGKFLEGNRLFWKIKYNLVSLEYFEKKGKNKMALKIIIETQKIAETLHFYQIIDFCKQKALNQNNSVCLQKLN